MNHPNEGCSRCACGCKYWENDRCIDCGELYNFLDDHIVIIPVTVPTKKGSA